ncbi:hypothetical protein K438DRAFT_1784533 [Mycena galopus ATCC 62051]|nr:hypothetical protein K438DRAFT_1784533 [Mycena galopus ATCC 62051]
MIRGSEREREERSREYLGQERKIGLNWLGTAADRTQNQTKGYSRQNATSERRNVEILGGRKRGDMRKRVICREGVGIIDEGKERVGVDSYGAGENATNGRTMTIYWTECRELRAEKKTGEREWREGRAGGEGRDRVGKETQGKWRGVRQYWIRGRRLEGAEGAGKEWECTRRERRDITNTAQRSPGDRAGMNVERLSSSRAQYGGETRGAEWSSGAALDFRAWRRASRFIVLQLGFKGRATFAFRIVWRRKGGEGEREAMDVKRHECTATDRLPGGLGSAIASEGKRGQRTFHYENMTVYKERKWAEKRSRLRPIPSGGVEPPLARKCHQLGMSFSAPGERTSPSALLQF